MEIFKIAAVGLTGMILAGLVKGYKPEFALYIVITTVLLIFGFILYKLTAVFDFLGSVYQQTGYGKTFFPILIKVLAVAYVSDFSAQLCRDAGETAIAGKVELAGKVIIFYLAVPIMMSLMELITKILPG